MQRWIGVSCLVLVLLMAALQLTRPVPPHRPSPDRWCFDFTQTLPAALVQRIDNDGYRIRKSRGVDVVLVILPSLEERDILPFAAALFSRWKIGKGSHGKKGILILIARREQQIKIEVGADLAAGLTDASIERVEIQLLKEFLEQRDWHRGFQATLENFLGKLSANRPSI